LKLLRLRAPIHEDSQRGPPPLKVRALLPRSREKFTFFFSPRRGVFLPGWSFLAMLIPANIAAVRFSPVRRSHSKCLAVLEGLPLLPPYLPLRIFTSAFSRSCSYVQEHTVAPRFQVKCFRFFLSPPRGVKLFARSPFRVPLFLASCESSDKSRPLSPPNLTGANLLSHFVSLFLVR